MLQDAALATPKQHGTTRQASYVVAHLLALKRREMVKEECQEQPPARETLFATV